MYLFKSFTHFLEELIVFLLVNSVHKKFARYMYCEDFLPVCGLPFIVFIVSFEE